MPFTQVKGTVTTGITKDNLHPERTQYQVILFVVIFCSTWQLDVHTHLFFVFCFCWGTKKVQATLLAIPAFVAITKKHVQNGNHAGHYCKGCPPASVNFSLETTHTHRDLPPSPTFSETEPVYWDWTRNKVNLFSKNISTAFSALYLSKGAALVKINWSICLQMQYSLIQEGAIPLRNSFSAKKNAALLGKLQHPRTGCHIPSKFSIPCIKTTYSV